MEKLEKITGKNVLGDDSVGLNDNLEEMKVIAFKNYDTASDQDKDSARSNYECKMSTCHCATW